MQDDFLEKIVPRRVTPASRLCQAAVLLAAAGVILLGLLFAGAFVGTVIVLAAGWGAWKLIQRQQVEYEYAVTSGELDVDVIYAQQSRKHLLTVAPGHVEALEPWKGGRIDGGIKVIDCTSGAGAQGCWRLLYRQQGQRCALLFEPSDAMVVSIRKYSAVRRG